VGTRGARPPLLLGAVVVLALLFGVLRPALRAITGPKPKERLQAPGLSVVDARSTLKCRRRRRSSWR
jgi:flagellar M-ring protein FliF